ncbi:SdrD B-like domain-containing protein [Arsenicibacter rosenii]|nr:SdrD B-like domain-containing protein [Arsenicibacter rosenii]
MGPFYTPFIRGGTLCIALLFFATITVFGQCAIAIKKVTVSGCYSVTGSSKATVSVEVSWTSAPVNSYIVVTTGAQSRTITPDAITVNYGNNGTSTPAGSQTIVSPQVVAFEINANGPSSTTVSARFLNTTSCTTPVTASYTVPASCNPLVCQTGGLGGVVFNDYDSDGVLDAGETNGVAGVTIKAYACDNTLYQATTDAFGKWSIGGAVVYPVRVEFTNIPPAFLNTSTVYGAGSKTTVQFVDAASCNVNLGVNDPIDYCQDNPLIITPCYVSGDPLVAGSAASGDVLVGFPYNSSGSGGTKTFMIPASTLGSTWAQVYSKYTKRLFSAATIKRHSGLGPGGLDAIYITNLTNPSSPQSLSYIKVGNLGVNVGAFISNSARGLVGDKTQPSNDPQSFTAIGKIGIGGMSMSSDGETLYFLNLSNNSLYALDLSVYNITLNTGSITLKGGPYAVPGLGCTNGQQRSWAVKYNKGKVYVGTICDGSAGTRSDMRAGVFAFDPATNTFSAQPVFDFPLTYPKGFPDGGNRNVTGWYPWTDSFSNLFITADYNPLFNVTRPTPILSDIEFDIDGSLVLAFNDRTGLQTGYRNYSTSGTSILYNGHIGGDILRAFYRNGTFVLENAAKAGPATGYANKNNQGPGFGEFYNDDSGVDLGDGLYHSEIGFGSLALRPGSGEVVTGVMDPTGVNTDYSFTPFSGGVRRMNNISGLVNDAYVVYQTATSNADPAPGTFGKAAGLGDMELTCNLVQHLQIGNRVWVDTDKDGIQDACEKGLPNVRVALYRGTTLVASTTTNAAGEYYFSYTLVQPNTAYQLVFGTGNQFSGSTLTVDNGKYELSAVNSTSATANDLNDSDAQIGTVAGITAPVVSLTTGSLGEVNHTFDVGFVCLTSTYTLSVTPSTCNATTALSNASIRLATITNGDKVALYPASQTTPPAYTATTNTAVVSGAVAFTGLSNPAATTGTAYNIIIFNGPCCSTVISVTLPQTTCTCALALTATPEQCDPVTNLYTVTGTVNLTNTPAGSLTVTDGTVRSVVSVTAGQASVAFSLTGLNSGSGTHTVSVLSSATICGSASRTYAAPASCTVPATVSVLSKTVCAGAATSLTATGCQGTLLWTGPGAFTSNSAVISVTTNAALTTTSVLSYTARCTTVTNTTTAIGTVTVVPIPSLTLTASSLTVTQGSNVTLTAAGCENGSFIWNVPGNTGRIAVVEATTISNTYSVTCITQPNCITTASVTVGGAPINLMIFTDNGIICAGQSVTLSAIGCDARLQWSTGATTTQVVVRPTVSTEYSVTCTNGSIVEVATGTVMVYPIPALTLTASSVIPVEGTSVTLTGTGCDSGTVVWSTGQAKTSIVVSPTVNTVYTATCTTGPQCQVSATISLLVQLLPELALEKYVNKTKAAVGEVISYTVVLSNTGRGTATNVIVRDSLSSGLAVVPGSVSVSQGVYQQGTPVSLWTLISLPPNTTVTLTFSASATSEGVVYNTATIPGDTNTVCTSIPIRVCQDSGYAIQVSAPAGYSRYQWLRRVGTAPETVVYDGILNSYTATAPGEYRVVVDDQPGKCPTLSCCPLIIEEDSIPAFSLVAKSPTCVANQPQANGSLTITGLGSATVAAAYRYAITEGTSFTATNPATLPVPSDGTLLSGLSQTKTYIVRVYNSLGCFREQTITISANCECPEAICVPVVIRRSRVR